MKWKDEKDMQSWFSSWLRDSGADFFDGGVAFELKLVKGGDTLANSRLSDHQVLELLRAAGVKVAGLDVVVYKISDSSIGYKPFDCFYLGAGSRGVIVVGFVEGDGEVRSVYMCNVVDWFEEVRGEGGGVGRGSVGIEWFRKHGVKILDG